LMTCLGSIKKQIFGSQIKTFSQRVARIGVACCSC
jgi:hypothetical protein